MTLLGQADERLLDRRRPAVTGEQSARVAAKLIDRIAKLTARGVSAEQPDADHLASKRSHQLGHVGRTARMILLLLDSQHGHGSVRAQPLGIAVHVVIEHEVADHHRSS